MKTTNPLTVIRKLLLPALLVCMLLCLAACGAKHSIVLEGEIGSQLEYTGEKIVPESLDLHIFTADQPEIDKHI